MSGAKIFENFRFLSKIVFFRIAIIFLQHITFLPKIFWWWNTIRKAQKRDKKLWFRFWVVQILVVTISQRIENPDLEPKSEISEILGFWYRYNFFPSKYTFSPIFKRFGIRSEKPKNEGNFCDFDFGGRNIFSNFVKISKIQKSTFQSLDSDRSLGPGQRPGGWEVVCELLWAF